MKTYPVGIVGEQHYQGAVRATRPGEHALLVHEPDNPYDADAVAVLNRNGSKIGYLASDCWLKRPLLEERGKTCLASIKSVDLDRQRGFHQVVLDVQILSEEERSSNRVQQRGPANGDNQMALGLGRLVGRLLRRLG